MESALIDGDEERFDRVHQNEVRINTCIELEGQHIEQMLP